MTSQQPEKTVTLAHQLIKASPWIGLVFGVTVAGLIAFVNRPERASPRSEAFSSATGTTFADPKSLLAQNDPASRSSATEVKPMSQKASDPKAAEASHGSSNSQPHRPSSAVPTTDASQAAASAQKQLIPTPARQREPKQTNPARTANAAVPDKDADQPPSERKPPFTFPGEVQTVDGKTWQGSIQLSPSALVVREANGNARTISLNQLKVLRPLSAMPASPHGVRGTYFRNQQLQGEGKSRLDAVIDFDWKSGAPMPGIPPENFSDRWEGQLEAPVTGKYTFYTESNDGVRLWIGGHRIIDQWNNHSNLIHEGGMELQAGKRYALKMEHYEQGGTAVARLFWRPPGKPRAIVPGEYLYPPPEDAQPSPALTRAEHGLAGMYFSTHDLAGASRRRIDSTIDFNWKSGRPMEGMGQDNFSVRWTGQIETPAKGEYTFYTESDDGVRLWINNRKLIDAWRNQSVAESKGTISLEAGKKYNLKLEYFESSGEAVVRLLWKGPSVSRSIIPARYLFPVDATDSAPPNEPTSPGVVLTGGSFLAGKVDAADDTRVQFAKPYLVPELAVFNVARIRLQSGGSSEETQLTTERVGLLLRKKDFVEGQFKSLVNSKITLDSVLYGRRTYNRNDVLLIAARPLQRTPAIYEVITRNASCLHANSVAVESEGVIVQSATLGRLVVLLVELAEIRMIRTAK